MRFMSFGSCNVLLSLLWLSILNGGCVRSTQPVFKDEQVVSNDPLLGRWVSDDGKVSGELKAGEKQFYKLSYTNNKGETGHFLVRFGKVGTKSVAEVRAEAFPQGANGEAASLVLPMYTLILYDQTRPDKLLLTTVNVDWFRKHIEQNPTELDVTSIGGQDLIVNSSTESFQDFCIKHFNDDGMLAEPRSFVRPGDPTTQPAGGK